MSIFENTAVGHSPQFCQSTRYRLFPAPDRQSGVNTFFLSMDLLILAVIIARCHREQHPVHTTAPFSAENSETFKEFTIIFTHPPFFIHTAKEKIAQAGQSKPKSGKTKLIRKGIPLGERKRAFRLITVKQGIEAADVVVFFVIAYARSPQWPSQR